MPRRNRVARAILQSVARSEQRSSLFWWLVDHHDAMVKAAEAGRIDWSAFCREASESGLTDTRGQPPTQRNARETWFQARKAVARVREAEASAPPRRLMPSRLSKDWRPAMLDQPSAARGAPAPPGAGAGSLPAPLPAFESGRSYGSAQIPDDQVDLSLAPETYEDDDGKIKPMPIEARLRFARAKMRLQASDARKFRILNG